MPSSPQAGENDLFTVLLHESGYVFGIGTADSWFNQVVAGSFTGPMATAEYLTAVPLESDESQWQDGINRQRLGTGTIQEVLFDPTVMVGSQKMLTDLDLAGLDDFGWQVVPEPNGGLLAAIAAFGWLRKRSSFAW